MPTAKKAPSRAKAKKQPSTTQPSTTKLSQDASLDAPRHPVPKDKWLKQQQQLLYTARSERLQDAKDLKAEADQMALDAEPGDTQFDDESGEGSTAAVDRERDLALSAQAWAEVVEIDVALDKVDEGGYGTCDTCAKPIPKARLEVIPWAALCVTCKSGGLSARR